MSLRQEDRDSWVVFVFNYKMGGPEFGSNYIPEPSNEEELYPLKEFLSHIPPMDLAKFVRLSELSDVAVENPESEKVEDYLFQKNIKLVPRDRFYALKYIQIIVFLMQRANDRDRKYISRDEYSDATKIMNEEKDHFFGMERSMGEVAGKLNEIPEGIKKNVMSDKSIPFHLALSRNDMVRIRDTVENAFKNKRGFSKK